MITYFETIFLTTNYQTDRKHSFEMEREKALVTYFDGFNGGEQCQRLARYYKSTFQIAWREFLDGERVPHSKS